MSAARPIPDLKTIQQKIVGKHFAEALDDLAACLETSPDNTEALYMSAVCHRYRREFDESLALLGRLRSLQPEHGRAYQEEGHNFRDMGQMDRALTAYSKATRCNPALEASWREQLEILATRGNEARAAPIRAPRNRDPDRKGPGR